MISIQLADFVDAFALTEKGQSWATIRFADGSRVVIHAKSREQAIAIASAVHMGSTSPDQTSQES